MGHTIYLVGARAAGKTTFGGALARQLGCNYVDTDIPVSYTHLDVYKRQPPLAKTWETSRKTL